MNYSPYEPYYQDHTKEINQHLAKTYALMAIGLLITFISALVTAIVFPKLVYNFYLTTFLIVLEVIMVLCFRGALRKANVTQAKVMFYVYALLTGITTSYIFYAYDFQSIFLCFGASAVSFGFMALWGYKTERDLSPFARVFVCGLIGLLVITIVGFFLNISALEIFICIIGLLLFLGVTAYDSQKLKYNLEQSYGNDTYKEVAIIYSALQFYLDFINIFFYILRLFGRRSK